MHTPDSDFQRVELLKSLYGLGHTLASTILTFYDPKRYGVFDIHIWRELFLTKHTNLFAIPDYLILLGELRDIASQQNFNVRDVEKALFKKISKNKCARERSKVDSKYGLWLVFSS